MEADNNGLTMFRAVFSLLQKVMRVAVAFVFQFLAASRSAKPTLPTVSLVRASQRIRFSPNGLYATNMVARFLGINLCLRKDRWGRKTASETF